MVCWLRVGQPTNRGFIPGKGRTFFSSKWLDRLCPVSHWTGSLSPGLKQPGREASSAEFKNAWRCTFTAQRKFVAWCLIKHKTNYFTFYSFVACSQYEAFVLDRSRPSRSWSARQFRPRRIGYTILRLGFHINSPVVGRKFTLVQKRT